MNRLLATGLVAAAAVAGESAVERGAVPQRKSPPRRVAYSHPTTQYSFETPRVIQAPNLAELPEMAPPVDNLKARELGDMFSWRRFGAVRHNAIDIFRPKGQPLRAVVDGVIEKLYESVVGGTTLYLVDRDGRYRFYYAHLDRYATGIQEGKPVRRGDLIGYLGNSGNARWTRPHLHFQVMLTEPTGAWWKDGGTLNPYPILMDVVRRHASGRVSGR